MRSTLITCLILIGTLLSVLAVAAPGFGKDGSNGKSGERSVKDDDDDSGGDSDDDSSEKDNSSDKEKKEKEEKGTQGGVGPEETAPDQDAVPPAPDPIADGEGPDSGSNDPSTPPPPPAVGRTVNVAPIRGRVLVRSSPGSRFVPLRGAASLPNGSLVDALDGAITLTSASDRTGATQTATFHGAVFEIRQDAGPRPVTELALRDTEGPISCELRRSVRGVLRAIGVSRSSPIIHSALREGSPTAAARKRRGRRGLWSNGRGRFRTRGRHGAASVRGTRWLTEDRCEGTFFRVTRGVVTVEDFARDRTVTLAAGDSYLARLRR